MKAESGRNINKILNLAAFWALLLQRHYHGNTFSCSCNVDFFIIYEHFRNIQPHANAVPHHNISHFLEINPTFDSCCHVGNLANLIESEGLLREDEWPPRRRSWRSRSSLEDLELLVLLFFKFRNMEIRSIFSSTGNSRHNSSPTLGSISCNFQEININTLRYWCKIIIKFL